MAFLLPLAVFCLIFKLPFFVHCTSSGSGSEKIIYEDGYTVTTVLDGNKRDLFPRFLSLRPGFNDAVFLDKIHNQFYTLSLPLSQESVSKKFAGNGSIGFLDGNASTAMFDKPESFAVDLKGNVYVADKKNFAVRKISKSGTVTTIAGGSSKKGDRADGPGRDATFSDNFDLTFVPDTCALLIVDHGHRLIRQISLKQENCVHSEFGAGVNFVWPWIAAVVFSCWAGLLVGFIIRPYIMPNEVFKFLNINKSWMCYLMNLGRQTRMHCFDNRSAVASPALKYLRRVVMLVCSHLSLLLAFMFKRVGSSSSSVDKNYVSLLDLDNSSSSRRVSSQNYDEQLKDLIGFSEQRGASIVCDNIFKEEAKDGRIDDLMHASIANFAADASKSSALEGPFLGVSTVVKRK